MALASFSFARSAGEQAGQRVAGVALAVILGVATVYFAVFHLWLIALPGPQEAREAAIPLTTGLILNGGTPYSLASSPAITNVYGIVYNYAVLPAAALFGSTFAVHRAASLVFLLVGAGMIHGMLRQQGLGRGLALAGATFYYLINATTYAIVARPDTLGGVFYLAVVFLALPARGRATASFRRLAVSAVLGVLAFYTKPYFILSLGLAAAVLLTTAGLRTAVAYAAGAGALFLASIPVVRYIWPYYLFSVYTTHAYGEVDEPGYFWRQFNDFLELHPGLLAVAVGAGAVWAWRTVRATRGAKGWLAKVQCWRPDPWLLCFALTMALTAAVLGRHVGAFRIYWTQLVTPFMILVAMRAVGGATGVWQTVGLGLLAVNAFGLASWERPPWPMDSRPAWEQWREFSAGHAWELLPKELLDAEPVNGVPVIDDGQTIYFVNIALTYLPKQDPAYARILQYLYSVRAMILLRRFDIIVCPNDFQEYIPQKLLDEHYQPYQVEFPIYFADYTHPRDYGGDPDLLVAWVRKPGPAHAEIKPAPAAAAPAAPAIRSASTP
jgi:hypothetical protein